MQKFGDYDKVDHVCTICGRPAVLVLHGEPRCVKHPSKQDTRSEASKGDLDSFGKTADGG